jgi:DNA uptake protein ComE-like DNA-binding protein
MKEMLRNFLALSSVERKGVIFLILIILLIAGFNAFLVFHRSSAEAEFDPLVIEELRAFERQVAVKSELTAHTVQANEIEEAVGGELFPFDPNSALAGDFRRLGLSNRLIRTILNYRLHGGTFRRKEDMNKIYGMSAELYNRLAPFITISEPSGLQTVNLSKQAAKMVPFDINLADSATLEQLPGIGPVLSKRIVRYRHLLGGFYDTGQLKEVYGLTDSLLTIIGPRFFADTATIRKINLNVVSERELAHHPYIGKYTARAIVTYRSGVQKINCIDELKVNGLISDEDLKKLKKYLTI